MLIVSFGCQNNPTSPQDNLILKIDARLERDSNRFYHLPLDRRNNQTLHRITAETGHFDQGPEMPKVYWQAYKPNGNVAVWIFRDQFGHEYEVEIANHVSYPDMNGIVNLMIAPVIGMVSDTVYVVGSYISVYGNELNDTVGIVFE